MSVAFAALGLLLVSVGVYSVLSYAVSRRTQEIGIRMALGAQANDVRRMVMVSGVALAGHRHRHWCAGQYCFGQDSAKPDLGNQICRSADVDCGVFATDSRSAWRLATFQRGGRRRSTQWWRLDTSDE